MRVPKATQVVGRERGIITDTLGPLLTVIAPQPASANVIGMDLLDQIATYPFLIVALGSWTRGAADSSVDGQAGCSPTVTPRCGGSCRPIHCGTGLR